MGEVKFRGKQLGGSDWVYGYLYEARDRAWIIYERGFQSKPNDVNGAAEYDSEPEWVEVDPKTVGQYTGLKDKNGKEVYEGDIVDCSPVVSRPTSIFWSAQRATFMLGHQGERTQYDKQELLYVFYEEASVIGNTHDNPGLLEAKS